MVDTAREDEITQPAHPDGASSDEPELEQTVETIVGAAVASVDADIVDATVCALGRTSADEVTSTASAFALSQTQDLWAKFSVVAAAYAEGDARIETSYTSAFVAGGQLDMSKSLTVAALGRDVKVKRSGAALVAGADVTVKKSWIGIVASPRTTISEDSRVVVTPLIAALLVAAILGGFGLVAVAIYLAAKRLAQWRPELHFPRPRLPLCRR